MTSNWDRLMNEARLRQRDNAAPDDAAVYVIIYPDGRAAWGGRDLTAAKEAMGDYGTGSAFVARGGTLRLLVSDVSLALTKEFAPNPYAAGVLGHLMGGAKGAFEMRGPVALYHWDPENEWDGSRAMTAPERAAVEAALAAAGCRVQDTPKP